MANFIWTGGQYINLNYVLQVWRSQTTNKETGMKEHWWNFKMVDEEVITFQAVDRDHSAHIRRKLLGEDKE